MRFSNKVVAIAGAASGIGRACAEAFVLEGARLALIDCDRKGLGAACEQLGDDGSSCVSFCGDAASTEAVGTFIAKVEAEFGRVDVMVNSVGTDLRATLERTSQADWERLMRTNVWTAFLLAQKVVPIMPGGGAIVNVSSAAGLFPIASRPAYNSSKAALVGLTRALALDLAPRIRVNCVCPGAVDTPLFRESLSDGEAAVTMAAVINRYPLQRIAYPAEIARAILFLASSEAGYVTGTSMAVDGGRTMH